MPFYIKTIVFTQNKVVKKILRKFKSDLNKEAEGNWLSSLLLDTYV